MPLCRGWESYKSILAKLHTSQSFDLPSPETEFLAGFSRKIAVEHERKVVWGKGEIILDSVQLASDSRVVWPLGCKSKNNHLNKNTRGQI